MDRYVFIYINVYHMELLWSHREANKILLCKRKSAKLFKAVKMKTRGEITGHLQLQRNKVYMMHNSCYSLCSKCYSKHWTRINSFNLSTKSFPVSTINVQMKLREPHNMSHLTQLVRSRAKIKTQAFWFRGVYS